MLDTIRKLLADRFKIPEENITEQTQLIRDLGADSLELIRLLMILEEDYGVCIEDAELPAIRTVGDIAEIADRKGTHADQRR